MKSVLVETDRLFMRPLKMSDLKVVCRLDMDPDVRSFFPEGALSEGQVEREMQRNVGEWERWGYGIFAVFEQETGHFIGRVGFARLDTGVVEFGYLILKEHWGKGYATEATQAILEWGFDNTELECVIGFAPMEHLASRRVLEKVGMVFTHTDFYQNIECGFYEIRKQ